MVGCESFEKKVKVDENEEIGVRGYGSEERCYGFKWEFGWRGCNCKLVLHDDKTTITSTWKYARYTKANVGALCNIPGTKHAIVFYVWLHC